MSIKFPEFSETLCVAIGACGTLDTEDKEILTVIENLKEDVLIASYRIGRATAYIRVLLGGTTSKHVHIDVYKREVFGKVPPKTTHKRKEIEEILGNFLGKKILTRSFGRFFLPVAELPEGGLIRSTFFGTKQGDLSITLSGANFAISGAPIRNLEWQFVKNGTSVVVDINARLKMEISRAYLNEQLQLLDSGFRLFVLGETTNGTD